MFESLRKKLKNTISRASTVEDDLEEEKIEELDGKIETEESKEEKIEESEDKSEKKSRFSFLKRGNKSKDNEDNSEEITDELKDESEVVDDKISEDESDKTEEDNGGRFSFLRRNKSKDNEDDSKEDEVVDDDDNKTEEDLNESEEENKSKLSFIKRDKKSEDESKKEEKSGRFSFITKKTISESDIEDILFELELSLMEGDVALEVAETISNSVKEDLIGKKISRRGDMEQFTTDALKNAITQILDNGTYDFKTEINKVNEKGEPFKIMFVGINGTGKTTTIAKLSTYFEKEGYTSVLSASDTFRAGAIEQLEHHANNLNVKIVKHERNSDPAAVAYDAIEHAKAQNKNIVMIDTAGRMQTNINLMDEMKKIKRISKPNMIIYVGDSLMGNDATEQATKFNDAIDITGIILTKADADAKCGAALSIGYVIHKPILFLGVGQSYDDMIEFDTQWMINQIFEEEAQEA